MAFKSLLGAAAAALLCMDGREWISMKGTPAPIESILQRDKQEF
jgi:hypothetical protein